MIAMTKTPNPLLENYIKKFKYKFRDTPKLPIRL